ncbi:hypothetical protein C7I55_09685 [Sphingomonas deserti]|uniref:Uncharacterized protein n=1 Tax=Allosphingosinicella deserti TaxID=2116704 RepID=A0A2P7QRH7_9SPHN|nr:hypothetical protein C7I55_09685 [Sphingomonas deserti]
MLLDFVLRAGELDLGGRRVGVGRCAFEAGREVTLVTGGRGGSEQAKEKQARQLRSFCSHR